MATTVRRPARRRARHSMADARHRRGGGHRRRVRRRLLAYSVPSGAPWSIGPVQNILYGAWLMPALVAPLIIRKPGAALFAELVAAGLSALLGSSWGVDTLLSGFVQGAAAELVFAFTLYRVWSFPVLARPDWQRLPRRSSTTSWSGTPATQPMS